MLALPGEDALFTVETDACDEEVGCVLLQSQLNHEKDSPPIGCWPRTITDEEENCDTTQQECRAVVWAVLLPRLYIVCNRFFVCTDNQILR